jgi:hypothetical protein
MARKLKLWVHVDGVAYGPDSHVPQDVAARIVNPKAWAAEDSDDTPEPAAAVVSTPPPVDVVEDPNRPRGNASRPDWAAYAASLNPPVEVTGAMHRDDIIAAVDARPKG